jgi:hypothetical protein
MFTFNMIMVVAVQQSEIPWSTAKTLMAYIRTAAETKPALRPDVVMWNQYLSYCVRYSGGGSGDKCYPLTETVGKNEELLRQMESEGGVEANVRSFTQLLQAWADSGSPEAPFEMEELLEGMKSPSQRTKIEPNVFCWTIVIKAWARSSLPGAANNIASLLQRMKTEGCPPTVATYNHVLSLWAASGLPEAPVKAE